MIIALSVLLLSISGFAKAKSPGAVAVTQDRKVVNIIFLPDSRIQISGDSTLRKFSAIASEIDLTGKAKEKPDLSSNLPWTPVVVEMLLFVKNLKSGNKKLDDHMHENLKAGKFPKIQLRLSAFNFSYNADNKVTTVAATGALTVVGVSKPIELIATITTVGKNLRIKGSKTILMSDFGIVPPTMMLGTLKTRDEIEISFDMICLINSEKKEKL